MANLSPQEAKLKEAMENPDYLDFAPIKFYAGLLEISPTRARQILVQLRAKDEAPDIDAVRAKRK